MNVTSDGMPADFVLDTFAIVAYLRNQPGADRVQEILNSAQEGRCVCHASAINLGEVAYLIERHEGAQVVRKVVATLDRLPIIFSDATRQRILAAAHIKALHPVSYADAFAIALAQELAAPVLTGDREFRAVEHLVQVDWIVSPRA